MTDIPKTAGSHPPPETETEIAPRARKTRQPSVLLSHGSGGKLSHDLIRSSIVTALSNPVLDCLEDAARVQIPSGRLAFTTDSYVVRPPFFPGGDIGKLAVCGTVNDLAVTGATPLFLTCGLILEEGFPLAALDSILDSASRASEAAGVHIVAGDTKVVEKGNADQIFVNTAGIGLLPDNLDLSMRRIQPGDAILVTGTLGDHGIAVLAAREGFGFETSLVSDCAPLNGLIKALLSCLAGETESDCPVRFMRDPTRGGVASTLNEIAQATHFGVEIWESQLPVSPPVRGMCELLGMDPLYIANEGKAIVVVAQDSADAALELLREHPLGTAAARIGRITTKHPGIVSLKTAVGGSRIVDMLVGDQLPRIC